MDSQQPTATTRRLLAWTLYAMSIALPIGVAVQDIGFHRRLRRVTSPDTVEFVSLAERESGTGEQRNCKTGTVRIDGLAKPETGCRPFYLWHRGLDLWRHGLSPATHLFLEPAARPTTVRWTLVNQVVGQTLTILAGGEILTRIVLPRGKSNGEATVPPHQIATTVTLQFSDFYQARGDPRMITATFTSLSVELP